ncbi:HpcH/HpaI aldolase/citrate lyase family protein [Falsiroseomonas stagni]|uniref:Citrate lyase subunit beta / citryl-CoA lyase n=1 Tax=Falsiroseomonas stagni DSM 19981 TaxID=1123062 RepID=A0A1I3ZNP9_9PROT|nr:aldolase/citrate lyase family protein [Falsiroseomonas stagni]SFK45712.1 citrate lyase subunit beta / citryl-CoA lyase [Falsiroseomonas stagni DSM 19981]
MTTPRLFLFAPANVARRAEGAMAAAADAAILDLEDAVPPHEKSAARDALAALLATPRVGAARRYVRVNAATTPLCLADLHAALAAGAEGIVLPKADSAEELSAFAWSFRQLCGTLGRDPASIEILPIVETARGLVNIAQLPWRACGITRVALGTVDLLADLGTGAADADAAILHAQRLCVAGSRAAGLAAPIDGVHLDVKDAAGAEAAMRASLAIGFGGKLAIHPAQIPPLRAGLIPPAAELEWAREVDAAYAAAQASGSGAIIVRGKLVDEPVAKRARDLIAMAGAG